MLDARLDGKETKGPLMSNQIPVNSPLRNIPTRQVRPEHRNAERDTPEGEPTRAQLMALIVGSYAEMPGLCLDHRQAARLFGLGENTCQVVMNDLVREGRLALSSDGRYRIPD